jgi:hypothetical protein
MDERLRQTVRERADHHFERNGVLLVGRSAVGRATVGLLKMNAADRRLLRQGSFFTRKGHRRSQLALPAFLLALSVCCNQLVISNLRIDMIRR